MLAPALLSLIVVLAQPVVQQESTERPVWDKLLIDRYVGDDATGRMGQELRLEGLSEKGHLELRLNGDRLLWVALRGVALPWHGSAQFQEARQLVAERRGAVVKPIDGSLELVATGREGLDVRELLVSAGLARSCPGHERSLRFMDLEANAVREGRGTWAAAGAESIFLPCRPPERPAAVDERNGR